MPVFLEQGGLGLKKNTGLQLKWSYLLCTPSSMLPFHNILFVWFNEYFPLLLLGSARLWNVDNTILGEAYKVWEMEEILGLYSMQKFEHSTEVMYWPYNTIPGTRIEQ